VGANAVSRCWNPARCEQLTGRKECKGEGRETLLLGRRLSCCCSHSFLLSLILTSSRVGKDNKKISKVVESEKSAQGAAVKKVSSDAWLLFALLLRSPRCLGELELEGRRVQHETYADGTGCCLVFLGPDFRRYRNLARADSSDSRRERSSFLLLLSRAGLSEGSQ
jgi:hypothetical protein